MKLLPYCYTLLICCILLFNNGCSTYIIDEEEEPETEENKEEENSDTEENKEGNHEEEEPVPDKNPSVSISSDTIMTNGDLPVNESIWGDKFFVWNVIPVKTNEIQATLITLDQGYRKAADAHDILSTLNIDGIEGWNVFTEEEAKAFKDSFHGEELIQLNNFLLDHGGETFKHDSERSQRYLCADCTKTFSFYNDRVGKAGKTVKYYYRAVKTVCVIKE